MICRNCYAHIPDNAVFCPYCGCEVQNLRKTEQLKEIRNQYIKKSIIVTAICIFFIYTLTEIPFNLVDHATKPTVTVSGKKMTMEDVTRLATKGYDLEWSDFEGYQYRLQESNIYPGNQVRIYYLKDKVKHYDGIQLRMSGNINEKPQKITLCFFENDFDALEGICEEQIRLREPEEFEDFLMEYKKNIYEDPRSTSTTKYRTNFFVNEK